MPNYTVNTLKAFTSAEGFGKNATGGRGGTVVHVTNLNESGPGSLLEAMHLNFPRIIVFDVAGTINWTSEHFVNNPNCTILGQTAPAPGITIEGATFGVRASNVIVRFLRVRVNDDDGSGNEVNGNLDGLRIVNFTSNTVLEDIVIDHLDVSQGTDENMSFAGNQGNAVNAPVRKLTIQNCLNSDAFGQYQYAMLMGRNCQDISIIRNGFFNVGNRVPEMAYTAGQPPTTVEFVNNILYNYNRPVTIGYGDISFDSVNNVFKGDENFPPSQPDHYYQLNSFENPNGDPTTARIHQSGNIQTGFSSFNMANTLWNTYNKPTRQISSDYEPLEATQLVSSLLYDIGASTVFSDTIASARINEFLNSTGQREYTSVAQAGGVPTLSPNSHGPNYDTNNDGISDEITSLNNITSPDQVITNWNFGTYTVTNNAGYTAIEMFAMHLAGDFEKLEADPVVKPNYTLNQLEAFPGAKGYGKFTSGGRGGQVIKVTNLNDSGPGSLREAIDTPGPRYIVFDIGGNFNLNSELNLGASGGASNSLQRVLDEEDCTILGQTAPGPGVTLTGGGLFIWSSNVCVRYLTSRPNDPNTSYSKSLRIRNDQQGGYIVENIMLDHLSLSHATDENLSIGGFLGPIRNISAQKCMMHKPLGAPDNGYSKNNITGTKTSKLSYVESYFSHASDRNPFIAYDDSQAEVINNIIYGFNTGINMVYGADADILYNILKQSNEDPAQFSWIAFYQNQTNNPTGQPEDSQLYHEGNIFLNGPESVSQAFYNNNALSRIFTDSEITEWLTNTQDIENQVLSDCGNVLYRSFDSLDQEVISDYYALTGNRDNVPVPSKTTVTRPAGYDSIITGIADTFTQQHGITSANQVKVNWDFGDYTVTNNAGYEAIEIYSFWLANDFSKLEQTTAMKPNYSLDTLKAFPTALGFGQNSVGGRGGAILHVNTLSSSSTGTYDAQTGIGYGSFRWAVDQTFPRTIVFDISGVIDLGGSTFTVNPDNVSILGQTAPGDGITFVNGDFRLNGIQHGIVRYLRFRDAPSENGSIPDLNTVSIINRVNGKDSHDIIMDHCSITGGYDEVWSVGAGHPAAPNSTISRVTLQNSIVGENKDGPVYYATLLGKQVYETSIIRNFFVNNGNRVPEHTYGSDSTFEFVNNLLYNYNRAVTTSFGTTTFESIGNAFKADANFPPGQADHVHQLNTIENPNGTIDQGWFYQADNIQIGPYINPNGIMNSNWASINRSSRSLSSPYVPVPSSQVPNLVINDVGPSLLFNDSYDARLFDEYENNTGVIGRSNLSAAPVNTVLRPSNYDSIASGIPDSFSIEHGIASPNQSKINWDFGTYTVTNNAGYTAIEMYSFWLAGDFEKLEVNTVLPQTPENFYYSDVEKTFVTLNWDPVPGVTGYRIYVDNVFRAATTSTQYAVSGLTTDTNYTFSVVSFVGQQESAPSVLPNVRTGLYPDEVLLADTGYNPETEPADTTPYTNTFGLTEQKVSQRSVEGDVPQLEKGYSKEPHWRKDGAVMRTQFPFDFYDGNTYAKLSDQTVSNVWGWWEDNRSVRLNENKYQERSADGSTLVTKRTFTNYDNVSIAPTAETTPSWDGRYWAFEGTRNGQLYMFTYDSVEDVVFAETPINPLGNGFTSASFYGNYAIALAQGSGNDYFRVYDLRTLELLHDFPLVSSGMGHGDHQVTIQGNECFVGRENDMLVMYLLESGERIELLGNASTGDRFAIGHVSGKNLFQPGWIFFDERNQQVYGTEEDDPTGLRAYRKVVSVCLDENRRGYQEVLTRTYATLAMQESNSFVATPDPTGQKVAFNNYSDDANYTYMEFYVAQRTTGENTTPPVNEGVIGEAGQVVVPSSSTSILLMRRRG